MENNYVYQLLLEDSFLCTRRVVINVNRKYCCCEVGSIVYNIRIRVRWTENFAFGNFWLISEIWMLSEMLLIQKRVLNDRGLQWENSVRQIPMHKEPICVFIQAFKAGAKNFKLNETASLCDVMVVTINDRCFHTKRTQMAEQCLF